MADSFKQIKSPSCELPLSISIDIGNSMELRIVYNPETEESLLCFVNMQLLTEVNGCQVAHMQIMGLAKDLDLMTVESMRSFTLHGEITRIGDSDRERETILARIKQALKFLEEANS